MAHQAGTYLSFLQNEATRSFYSPLVGLLVHRWVTPSIKFAGTQLNTCVERGTVRVKCLAQEHNTMSPARAGTWTTRPGDEATTPPTLYMYSYYVNTEKKCAKGGGVVLLTLLGFLPSVSFFCPN